MVRNRSRILMSGIVATALAVASSSVLAAQSPLDREEADVRSGLPPGMEEVMAGTPRALRLGAGPVSSRLGRGAEAAVGPAPLEWEHRYDYDHGTDISWDAAAARGKVYAAGWGMSGGNGDWLVRAIRADNGALLWRDEHDRANQYDLAAAIAVGRAGVFAAGWTRRSQNDVDFTVRAYSRQGGALIWEDRLNGAPSGFDIARTVVTGGSSVFAAGATDDRRGNRRFLVRAYNGRSGEVLWTRRHDEPGGYGIAYASAMTRKRLYVVGRARNSAGKFEAIARAYVPRTGVLLWETRLGRGGGDAVALDVVVNGATVLVVGRGGDLQMMARTLDAKTGAVLWDDDEIPVGQSALYAAATDDSGRYFVAGWTYSNPATGLFVRAYDAATGRRLWQEIFKYRRGFDWASDIAVVNGEVVAAGTGEVEKGNTDLITRVYDAASGRLRWTDKLDTDIHYYDGANSVTSLGDRAFVAGYSSTRFVAQDFVVRAYEMR